MNTGTAHPNRRIALAILVGVAFFLVDRWLILSSNTHLLFDLNDAEYGFVRAVMPFDHYTAWEVWSDPELRRSFLHNCRTVGNQVHGSLALTGTLFLTAIHLPGVVISTLTMKLLALSTSAMALLLWCLLLARSYRSWKVPLAFALLYTLAPPVFLKLGLLLWGTHEVVILLQALLLCLTGPWLASPSPRIGVNLLRALLVGAGGAALVLGNYAMLLPVGLVGAWLIGMAGLDGRQRPLVRIGLMIGMAGMAITGFTGALQLLLSTGLLSGIGFPARIEFSHFLLLAGKSGQPFLFESTHVTSALAEWQGELLSKALPMVPGASYGQYATTLELTVRGGCGVIAALALAWMGWRRWHGDTGGGQHRERRQWAQPLTAFLACYLLVGWLGITLMSTRYGLSPGGVAGIQPRYYAQLYPIAFGLLASLAAGRLWLSAAPLLGVLWLGAWENAQLIDTGNLGALHRYDGVRAWLHVKQDREPAANRVAFGAASKAFLDGYLLIAQYQHNSYWRWQSPAQMSGHIHINPLRKLLEKQATTPTDPDFWRGVGYAYRVLIPTDRQALFEEICQAYSTQAQALQEGYELERSALEARSP